MKRKVIIVTDGDEYALRTIAHLAKEFDGRTISRSQANPSRLSGSQIVQLIKEAPYDPIFVLFDDSGFIGEGNGETALEYVANHEDIDVIGILAVASKTKGDEWTKVHVSVDRDGHLTEYGVDKYGVSDINFGRISGDTVYCLDRLKKNPFIVGIGDIGKMSGADDIKKGSPVTRRAIQVILERSGKFGDRYKPKDEDWEEFE